MTKLTRVYIPKHFCGGSASSRPGQWESQMNAGKCDNYGYSEKQTQRTGEGGNYCSTAREGKYMFPFLGLNIYPTLSPADSHSGDGTHTALERPLVVFKWCLKPCSPLPPQTQLPLVRHLQASAAHTHTVTHADMLSLAKTHTPSFLIWLVDCGALLAW